MSAPRIELPAAGHTGRRPKCPYDLAGSGMVWWKWAWRTPQATQWDRGTHYHVARRALLEDDQAALGFEDELELHDLLAGADPDAIARVKWALTLLKQSASGSLAVKKEMRELDTRLGLNPQGMATLGWTITGEKAEERDPLDELTARRRARPAGSATA